MRRSTTDLVGFRYWTASLLPALVGTTLPFWLQPQGFTFRWRNGVAFLLATVLFHAGLSLLQAWFDGRSTARGSRPQLLGGSAACILAACSLGLLVNRDVPRNPGGYEHAFLVFGLSAIVAGLIYVAPPARLGRRIGGEIVLAEGLGMMPVLGAYLAQVGALTRTVYLASLPLVVATGLWVWIDELVTRTDDERTGRRTLVTDLGPRFSGRYGVPGLVLLLGATLLVAVFSASLSPWALAVLFAVGLVWRIVAGSWAWYDRPEKMIPVRRGAIVLHLVTGSLIAASSLATEVG